MADWVELALNGLVAFAATFAGVGAAFYLDERVRRRDEKKAAAAQEAKAREEREKLEAERMRLRRDLLESVGRNVTLLDSILKRDAEGRWLPAALFEVSVWQIQRGRFLEIEHDEAVRSDVARFFEGLDQIRVLVALGRMERERIAQIQEARAAAPSKGLLSPALGPVRTAVLVDIEEKLKEQRDLTVTLGKRLRRTHAPPAANRIQ